MRGTVASLERRRLAGASALARGERVCDIARNYGVSRHTVYRWIARTQKGTLLAQKKTGRPSDKKNLVVPLREKRPGDQKAAGVGRAMTINKFQIKAFLRESNRIEGIARVPFATEVKAFTEFLLVDAVTVENLSNLQNVFAPGKPLRDRVGMNVRVGSYAAPRGGPEIRDDLEQILRTLGARRPWETHVDFERVHPFTDGNGRSGRALWAWQMIRHGKDPFALGFLHSFYYQTLEYSANFVMAGGGR